MYKTIQILVRGIYGNMIAMQVGKFVYVCCIGLGDGGMGGGGDSNLMMMQWW